MAQSQHPYYAISSGSDAAILWYQSLPDHVKRLYVLRGECSQQPALMVILAEVVCEAFTVWAVEELFKKKKVENLWKELSAGKMKRRYQDICDERVRKIYAALSGDEITQTTFWKTLKRHNDRRNLLVHPDDTGAAAAMPSPQEAEESFKAVEDYIKHVHGILNSFKA